MPCTLSGHQDDQTELSISTVDLFSAPFDASKLELDQLTRSGSNAPLSRGVIETEATAVVRGGVGLESGHNNFAPRSPSATLAAYADEVVEQLPGTENQTFDFVLVHPQRSAASAEIWNAFAAFVDSCRQAG